MTEKPKVNAVYIFPNGMVAVFDEKGEQIPGLQGVWDEMARKVLNVAGAVTIFYDYRSRMGVW